jgi:hypothetical protein
MRTIQDNANPRNDAARRDSKDQFEWLRQVAYDCDLPPAASRASVALLQYFNRQKGGWAWMSQATLAQDLGISERTVRDVLSALVNRGHLIVNRRGKKETNRYRLALKDSDRQNSSHHDRRETADHAGVTGNSTSSDRQNRVKVTGEILPPNPIKEPIEEPSEKREEASRRNDSSGRRRRQPTSCPDAYTPEMIAYAFEHAGWTSALAASQFENFRDYHLKKDNQFADWLAAWRSWVRKGLEFEKQRAPHTGATIDQNGNSIAAPTQRRPPYPHRESTTERMRKKLGGVNV